MIIKHAVYFLLYSYKTAEHTVHVEVVFPATALESATFKLTQVSSC